MEKRTNRNILAFISMALLGALLVLAVACKKQPPSVEQSAVPPQEELVAEPQPSAVQPPEASTPTKTPPGEPPESERASPNPFENAKQALAAAREAAGKQQIDKAIDFYLAALELEPKSARARVEIAALSIPRKDAANARQLAQQAVELEPRWSRAWNTLGRVELLDGQLKRAARAFSEATKHNPGNIFAWNNLGLVRIKQRRYGAAVKALERATAGKEATAYMFNNLGVALERLDEIDRALAAYKEGLARGSGLSGQNFVRLEQELDKEETAQHTDDENEAKTAPPNES